MSEKNYYNIGNDKVINEVHGGTIFLGNTSDHIELDYDKIITLLSEIQKYKSNSEFEDVFQENNNKAQSIINEALDFSMKKEKSEVIRSYIKTLSDLAVGTSGSLIATGIIGIIKRLMAC